MSAVTRPLLFGLTGRAGTGKDTIAAYLEDQYAFTAIGFADPLRDMLAALLHHVDVDGAWMVERALKERPLPVLGASYRKLAQTLGSEWGRNVMREEFWIDIAAHRAAQALELGSNVVISDVRFPNEAAWLRERGGLLLRIRREALAVRSHESEQWIDTLAVDDEIDNSNSLGTTFDQVDRVMDRVRNLEGGP